MHFQKKYIFKKSITLSNSHLNLVSNILNLVSNILNCDYL